MPTASKESELIREQIVSVGANGSAPEPFRRLRSAATTLAIALLFLTPLLLCVSFVLRNFVEVPIEDDMYFFIALKKYVAGDYTVLQILMHRMLEHRVGMMLILMYSVGKFFAFQSLSWAVATLVFLSATTVLLCLKSRQFIQNRTQLVWLVPIVCLLFSLRQWETLLWGACVDLAWSIFLVVSTFLCLERSKRFDWFFGGACLCAALGAFSHAAAMMVLPVGVLLLLLPDERRTLRASILKTITWIGLSVYLFSGTHGSQFNLATIKQNLPDLMTLWLAALGNPLGCESRSAIAAGSILLCTFIYCFYSMVRSGMTTIKVCAVPVALCLFWLLDATCISVGRFGAGLEVACLSRYSTNLTAGVLGVYLFCLALKSCGKTQFRLVSGLVLGVIAQGLITSAMIANTEGETLHDNRLALQNIIQNYKLQSEDLFKWISYNQKQYDPGLFPFMDQNKYGLFALDPHYSSKQTGVAPIPNYLLEEINSEQVHTYPVSRAAKCRIGKDTSVQFRGYAADFSTRRPCEELKVLVGNVVIPATMGIFRKDVVKRFHKESFKGCGFVAVCDPKLIGPGTHKVVLKMRFPGQSTFVDSGQLATLQVD